MANSDNTVTLRGLAAEIGKSHVWVLKLCKAGIIPRNPDGSIPHREALEAYRAHMEQKGGGSAVKNTGNGESGGRSVPMADIDEAVSVGMSYNKAKTVEKIAKAKKSQLEVKLLEGTVVEKKEVEIMAMNLAEKVRGKLMTVGVRIAGLCEGRTAREIEELIDTEINAAMADLRKDWLNNE